MLYNIFTKSVRDRWLGTIIAFVSLMLMLLFAMSIYRNFDINVYQGMPGPGGSGKFPWRGCGHGAERHCRTPWQAEDDPMRSGHRIHLDGSGPLGLLEPGRTLIQPSWQAGGQCPQRGLQRAGLRTEFLEGTKGPWRNSFTVVVILGASQTPSMPSAY